MDLKMESPISIYPAKIITGAKVILLQANTVISHDTPLASHDKIMYPKIRRIIPVNNQGVDILRIFNEFVCIE
jgi:hypothetical protein